MNKAILLAASVLLAACGGGGGYDSGGSNTPAGLTYSIGGTVSGLNAGGTVVLQNNGGNDLSVTANGPFTFSAPINYATGYDVSVLTNPTGQTCSVTNAIGGYPGMSVTNVAVTCH
ncbi:MAG: hypothetical protein JO292_11275 [Betaproteobacteria bacterium]|nr:hypothetical protein [Betaproteobacteria bacterium]MBV9361959.1 hypothetical protein [Betaproteobacteria bacterium]